MTTLTMKEYSLISKLNFSWRHLDSGFLLFYGALKGKQVSHQLHDDLHSDNRHLKLSCKKNFIATK